MTNHPRRLLTPPPIDARNGARVKRPPETIVAVGEWMRKKHPTWTVDFLLTHPIEAALMALRVIDQREPGSAAIAAALVKLVARYPAHFIAIDDVCRAAMNARKNGKLRPTIQSARARARAKAKT